jgi:H/ACA ribonucleoprotein complex subunit 4
MQELRRIRSGPFKEEHAITMYELTDAIDLKKEGNENNLRALIHPVEDGLKLIPKLWVRDSAVEAICHGAQLAVPGITKYENGIGMNNLIAAFTLKDECIALMKSSMTSGQIQANKHCIAAKPVRVIMPRGTYPKKW